MTAEEAIFKMLVRVLKNQRCLLWAAHRNENDEYWEDDFGDHAKETENLLKKVMKE